MKNKNGVDALVTWHNHSLVPTAASFGWIVEAAAAQRLRSAEEAQLTANGVKVITTDGTVSWVGSTRGGTCFEMSHGI